MEIIYNNLKKAICFILVWVLLFPCFILDVSAYENIDGAIEYIESNDVLYKIEKHYNETIITNLITNEVTKIVQTGEFACFISLSNGEFHSIDLKDNYLYFDNEIKVAKIEKYVEEIQPFGMNGPWYYAYTIKCSSTYDKQGRDIVTNIIGYIPYLGVTSLAFFYLSGKRIDSTKNINWYYMGLGVAMQFQILWILLKNRYLKDQ